MKSPIIETNLSFEFMCTIMGIAYYEHSNQKNDDPSLGRFDHYMSDFVKDIYPIIPNIIKKDIQLYIKDFSCMYVTLLDTILRKHIVHPNELISHFMGMSTREFLNYYLSTNETGLTTQSEHSELVGCLNDLSSKFQSHGIDATLFFEFERYPENVVSRFTRALSILYEDFFKPKEDDLLDKISLIQQRHQELFQENPDAFINAILFQSKESLHEEDSIIKICVSYLYGDKVNVAYGNDKDVYFFYGYQAEKKLYTDNLTSQYEELIKSLVDDTRRKLIKYLMNQPHYNKEISDYLGITTATISYHISRLTDLGIIHLKYQEGKRIYYQVDKERFNQLFDGLKRFLTSTN